MWLEVCEKILKVLVWWTPHEYGMKLEGFAKPAS